jgi:aminopeptidase N
MISLLFAGVLAAAAAAGSSPGPGIPENLARDRARAIRSLRYELTFVIPEDRKEAIRASEVLRFTLKSPERVVLDFAQPRDRVLAVRAGGRPVEVAFVEDHVVIPASATKAGENTVAIEFIAGEDSLNRNDEFLYSLFVPARARLAFPCFDQPDLKGRYTLTLDIPSAWQVVANGAERERRDTGDRLRAVGASASAEASADRRSLVRRRSASLAAARLNDERAEAGRTRVRFAQTERLPTYLFSFAAGRFSVETADRNGRTFRMFHRETDAAKVARNRDAIFDLHARALAWLEDYTGIRYPFGKFDFVLIPSFQFGGMEHAGAILYNAAGLMLDESATQNQLLGRASTIAHETAHMWFGDLVTMEWFNDVWMKEVFASFMAAKIVNPSFPEVNHELRFLLSHYPSAYEIDRTAGSNPIRQQLSNLSEAGQLYGAIIYQKAPIVMRQLELIVGERPFRDGLREYLRKYAFDNATWLDLVRILDARTPHDLAAWSRAWVEQRGRPEFTAEIGSNERSLLRVRLTMRDPLQRGVVWPQVLRVTIGYADGTLRHVPGEMNRPTLDLTAPHSPAPVNFVLPNGQGLGYGLFLLDEQSRTYLLGHVDVIPDPLTRGSVWVTLWENLLEGRVTPAEWLNLSERALPAETDEQNTQRALGYLEQAFWKYLPPADRVARAPQIERLLRDGLARAKTTSRKSAWFSAFRDVVLTRDGLAWLERVWRREEKIDGLPFSETDEIAMALELAVREVPGWEQILKTQLERTQNPDRKARFAFAMPALSSDPGERERSFARFRDVENRRREPWVLECLQYLHHPLRSEHARRFIRPSLEMLREIQRTGDIFFPKRWMDGSLGGHDSPEAATTVWDFLAANPDYPLRLRWTILSAADELFRASGGDYARSRSQGQKSKVKGQK